MYDDQIAAILTSEGHRSPNSESKVLPITVQRGHKPSFRDKVVTRRLSCNKKNRYARVNSKIDDYLRRVEDLELQHSSPKPSSQVSVPESELTIRQLQQLGWTLLSLAGLKHLHDGSILNGRALVRSPFTSGNTLHVSPPNAKRILLTCSETWRSGLKTGMQRVTRNLAKYGEVTGAAVPCSYRAVTAREKYMPFQNVILNLDRNDILFLPETSEVEHDIELVKRAVNVSAEIVVLVHDLIPFSYSATCDPDHVDHARYWFKAILPLANRIISPTKATALEVKDFMRSFEFKRVKKIGWFHHGADLDEINQSPTKEISNTLLALGDTPVFLSVGTLEPRKCHHIALDAFDVLWRAGLDVCYIICGKKGWKAESLENRILTHPKFGSRLFWFKNASDADLELLYKSSSALLFSSIAEGFGLPFIEAMHYGTPVIASDIPVFREIGQNFATYFTPADADSLAKAISDALNTGFKAPNCKFATWKEAGELVFGLVRDDPRFEGNWIGS